MVNITPEEKLLGLIKQGHGKANLKKKFRLFPKVNIVLIFIIGLILTIFIVDLFLPDYKTPQITVDIPAQEIEPVSSEDDMDIDIPIDMSVGKMDSISAKEAAKDLNLLGIVTGDNDQAIIEDKKLNKTFFLYKGNTLGDFRVDGIKENRVILEYKGEKVELSM